MSENFSLMLNVLVSEKKLDFKFGQYSFLTLQYMFAYPIFTRKKYLSDTFDNSRDFCDAKGMKSIFMDQVCQIFQMRYQFQIMPGTQMASSVCQVLNIF
ncbi:hypothetical protein AR687_22900 [Flavobacteriaceae bacterium CRH]|nr:hypothetical protein AR687_22900 [Flavobacteriaceae bacterium CRH]